MIEITDKAKCCGCTACKEACPTGAIEMKEDEQGFLYPCVNQERCVNCKKCNRVCPILNPVREEIFNQKAFLLQHKDKEILLDSASGGAFTAIAEIIIEKGGVVFGAQYDSDFNVIHGVVDNKEDLQKFRNSKYVQSDMLDNYRLVKSFILKRRYVLFSGTPCQIEGLLNYLGKESEYLFTADIVCHAVPSPAVWRAYLAILKDKGIKNLRFRDKEKYGYLYSQFKIESDVNKYEGIETNVMLRAFFSEICNRPSCYECQFKKRFRRSDFTMWDCFDLAEFSKVSDLDQNLGISRLLIHSEKAYELVSQLHSKAFLEEIAVEKAIGYDAKEMFSSVIKNEKYNDFWDSFEKNNEKTLNDFFAPSLKNTIEGNLRQMAYKTGVYPIVRRVYKKLFGNRRR